MLLEEFIAVYDVNISRFAEAINVSRSLMYQVIAGTRKPSPEFAKRIQRQTNTIVLADEVLYCKKIRRQVPKITPLELYTPVKKWPKLKKTSAK